MRWEASDRMLMPVQAVVLTATPERLHDGHRSVSGACPPTGSRARADPATCTWPLNARVPLLVKSMIHTHCALSVARNERSGGEALWVLGDQLPAGDAGGRNCAFTWRGVGKADHLPPAPSGCRHT